MDNYFFDVNNLDFSINPQLVVDDTADPSYDVQYSDGPTTTITGRRETGQRAGAVDHRQPAHGAVIRQDRHLGRDGAEDGHVHGDRGDHGSAGVYPVTAHVTDGTETKDVAFTITVTAEDATSTYTVRPRSRRPKAATTGHGPAEGPRDPGRRRQPG